MATASDVRAQSTRWAGPPDMDSVGRVCWGVRRVLLRWRLREDVVADTVLVVGELITNAVEHAGTDWVLVVRPGRRYLTIAVDDGAVGPPPAVREPTADYASGLRVVNAVAARWGWREHAAGKTVWAELLT